MGASRPSALLLHFGLVVQEDSDGRDRGPEDKWERELETEEWNGDDRRENHRHRGRIDLDNVVGVFHHHRDRESRKGVVEDHGQRDQVIPVEKSLFVGALSATGEQC